MEHSQTLSLHIPGLPAHLEQELQVAQRYLNHQHARATRRAYAADWRTFTAWCAARALQVLPASPETVALFLSAEAEAGCRPSTLARRAAAIRLAHRAQDYEPPTNSELVKATLRGIRRSHGAAPLRKAPALADQIRRMADLTDPTALAGLRDRALLLLGFAGALRRSELVALHVDDLEETPRGLRLTLRRSKTDQEGAGETVPVIRGGEFCPVEAVKCWQITAGIAAGPLFRRVRRGGQLGLTALSPYAVALIIKRYAAKAELDPRAFSGHSLRSGFLTSAAMNRASLFKLREVSRHKSLNTLQVYVRQAEVFDDHAGEGLL
ncbi:MAG: site-specific integrase [Gammaproteobacteria bacterium]